MRVQKLELAKQFGIAPEHMKWYGAFHNEPSNEGHLFKQGLMKIKSAFATEIFRHELDEIYQTQTQQRDELTKIARYEIAELVERIRNGSCDNQRLNRLMRDLADKLKDSKGRKVYGFLSPELKSLVNEITDTLTEDEDIKRLYDLWYESKYAILKSYTQNLPPQKPLSQEETFKPIKNAVIREALKLTQNNSQIVTPSIISLMNSASRILEERINDELTKHPELAVDSKLRREIEAKKRGVQFRM